MKISKARSQRPQFNRHYSDWDWCHLCGRRSGENTEIRYSHDPEAEPGRRDHYIRICADCGDNISVTARYGVRGAGS